jgi:hypothetical protein
MNESLSKNTRKEETITCRLSRLDRLSRAVSTGSTAWVKDGEKGKFLSLSAKADEVPKAKSAARDWQRPAADEDSPRGQMKPDEEIQMMDLD